MTTAQLQYYENYKSAEGIVCDFEKLGILPHTKPNAIGMWPNEQLCLVWSALQCNPDELWVEVGSFCGGSTILLGMAKEGGKSNLMAIDTAFNPMFDYNIKRSKLQNIQKVKCESITALWHYAKAPVGFAFLDGWHSFRSVVLEFEQLSQKLSDDAIVGFHDVSPKMWTHDTDYINELNNQATANYERLVTSPTEDFLIDEAIAYICVQYNYEVIDIPVREPLAYFQETRLNEWVRGRTSPHNAYAAIRKRK